VGYTPNVEQSEQVRLTLRTLYALVPSICNMIAFFIALAYPISSRIHRDIRTSIAERKKGRPTTNPLKQAETLT